MSAGFDQSSGASLALPDRYRIRRHIANGGMASVWCAEDLVLGRSVAVKVLAERFAHDRLAVLRFQREARAAARVCNHPHVVTVYDVGELQETAGIATDATTVAGRAFIVMEFLAGGTVADAIRHDAVRRVEAMRWLAQAASALDHAHAHGIVHRDIKPANFLLDRNRTLHVADFGIARVTTEETITSSDELFGTAAYLSPEQALGREATGASDRYALAVTAFELLAGERPFSAPHFSAQARQHIEEPPPAASEIDASLPPAVDDVLFAGLAKDPAQRPATAGALIDALDGALRDRSRPTRRPDPPRTARRMPEPAVPTASTVAARRPPAKRPPGERMAGPSRHGGRRVIALGALTLALVVVVGIALAATRTRHDSHAAASAVADRPTPTHRHSTTRSRPHATHTVTHTATTKPVTATTPTTPSAADLESEGHEDILDGNITAAIPTLRQAVQTAATDSPTYAYALFDLGHAEVLDGNPSAAIPILRQRLQIPDQTSTVRQLLDEAIAQAGRGRSTSASGGAGVTSGSPTTPAPPSGTGPTGPGGPSGSGSGGAGLGGTGATGQGQTTPQTRTAGRHHGLSLQLLTAAATG